MSQCILYLKIKMIFSSIKKILLLVVFGFLSIYCKTLWLIKHPCVLNNSNKGIIFLDMHICRVFFQKQTNGGLKLMHTRTHGVQMKGFLQWLVCWACRAGTKDFLSRLGCSSQPTLIKKKIKFSSYIRKFRRDRCIIIYD